MFDKDINQITEEDLQSLIDYEVPEGKKLDYKEILPGNRHDDKKEFLKDVSAFTNTSGGLLIYGISEDSENGIPEEIKGLDIANPDDEISRLENIIRNGIEPKISPIEIVPIEISSINKFVILVKVPKSWRSPHRVSQGGHNKFYLRISNTNHEMDVSELRAAFNLSETLIERVKRFREDRLSDILADETQIELNEGAKIVVHLIPINAFDLGQNHEIESIVSEPSKLKPIYCSGWNHRRNFDGFLTFCGYMGALSSSYVQLFRNGIIESTNVSLLMQGYIPSVAYETEIVSSIKSYLEVLKELNTESPILIYLAFLRVKGFKMATSPSRSHEIDKENLILPEVLIEDYNVEPEEFLKPCFDAIWNACGFPKSRNYNADGEWNPK